MQNFQLQQMSISHHITIELFQKKELHIKHTGVPKNRGTPKSWILIEFSITNHPFWGTPIFGNTQYCMHCDVQKNHTVISQWTVRGTSEIRRDKWASTCPSGRVKSGMASLEMKFGLGPKVKWISLSFSLSLSLYIYILVGGFNPFEKY